MAEKKKEELPDYTVAHMDLEGMPWNSRRPWQILPGRPGIMEKKFSVHSVLPVCVVLKRAFRTDYSSQPSLKR